MTRKSIVRNGIAPYQPAPDTRKDGTSSMSANGLLAVFLDARTALLRFLTARGATPDEAEDVLQDIYLKLRSDRSGPVAEPRAYLYRMTANQWLDRRRAAMRRDRREAAWLGDTGDIDDRPAADARLIAADNLSRVRAALDALPARTVEIFQRYRLDAQPQQRIADDLGISLSAVEKHLQRAYATVLAVRRDLDTDSDAQRSLAVKEGNDGD